MATSKVKSGKSKKSNKSALLKLAAGNDISNSGDGFYFEHKVQAVFVALALAEGELACFPKEKVVGLKFQARKEGGALDDLVVSLQNQSSGEKSNFFIQIKRSVSFGKGNQAFKKTIVGALNHFKSGSFNCGRDKMALATGPTGIQDTESFPWMCNQARQQCLDEVLSDDFEHPESPKRKRVVKAIREFSGKAVCGLQISEKELYDFLRSFYVLQPDLWYEGGITESLVKSLLPKAYETLPSSLWDKLLTLICEWNRAHSALNKDIIERSLDRFFERKKSLPFDSRDTHVPASEVAQCSSGNLMVSEAEHNPIIKLPDSISHDKLSLLALLGAWDMNNVGDLKIVSEVVGIAENSLSEVCHSLEHAALAVSSNGRFSIRERVAIFEKCAHALYDADVARFKRVVVRILSQYDKRLDVAAEERIYTTREAAGLLGTDCLRTALAEGLAIFSSRANLCTSCSVNVRLYEPGKIVSAILGTKSWKVWATLDQNLYCMAEAAPAEFLQHAERLVDGKDPMFVQLAKQEHGYGVCGCSYITGFVRALAVIAWEGALLLRVSDLLGKLALLDPGGQWCPRPKDIIGATYLPIAPQTTATVRQRVAGIKMLAEKYPTVLASILQELLPRDYISFVKNEYKPRFRHPVADDEKLVGTWGDVWSQYDAYEEIAVEFAIKHRMDVASVVAYASEWTPHGLEVLQKKMKKRPAAFSENECEQIWERIKNSLRFSKERLSSADGAKERIEKYICVLEGLERVFRPKELVVASKKWFSWDLECGNNETEQIRAVEKICKDRGFCGILELAKLVNNPQLVGVALAKSKFDFDDEVLSHLMDMDESLNSLYQGYVVERFLQRGLEWCKDSVASCRDQAKILKLFLALPFKIEVWKQMSASLDDSGVREYWRRVRVHNDLDDADAVYAAGRLLDVKRPYSCLRVLRKFGGEPKFRNGRLIYEALMLGSKTGLAEEVGVVSSYELRDAVLFAQGSGELSEQEKVAIEWIYLNLFEVGLRDGLHPITIESVLARDAEFFIELLCMAYRSKEDRTKRALPEDQLSAAKRAWQILHYWSVVPGSTSNGGFDEKQFSAWVRKSAALSKAKGRYLPFQIVLGHCLIFTPKGSNGFWMQERVAKYLNAQVSTKVRNAFQVALFNSRGVHWVDKTGREDRELEDMYRRMAIESDERGFHRVAAMLNNLADEVHATFVQMMARDIGVG